MENLISRLTLLIVLLPLFGALINGLLCRKLDHKVAHVIAVTFVGIAFFLACYLFKLIVLADVPAIDINLYTWATAGMVQFNIGFLLDHLSVIMTVIVLFVSFMVHIYTIGYMADDPGYNRFFSYVSLFTFSMLVLVLANNFVLLFFGWEGVGLVSYLLIGFWFTRETANFGSLKAFLVNRIGDIGFLLAIAAVLMYCRSLSYQDVFATISTLTDAQVPIFHGITMPVITLICLLLFVGAMGKSAQVPLHVWLPESMEGPTPISALIHAATMVTAGIYMVARMSPIFEYSPLALSVLLVIGGTTAFFMGLLAITQYDIKRVIAYSTISQLGYMAVALGASAYDAAIFHLVTHAFFKALLFLCAGSVIVALHHEQDMRKMGNLAMYLPVTYITFLMGALALSAVPPFSGFYSKDIIIESAKLSSLPGAGYAYWCVLLGAFITPLYIFRAFFLTFHTNMRVDPHLRDHIKESPWVILIPLIALAIPSVFAGKFLVYPMIIAQPKLLGSAVFVLPAHDVLAKVAHEFETPATMALKAGGTISFWLVIAGIITAWLFVAGMPAWSTWLKTRFSMLYYILVKKYGFDDFNQIVLVQGTLDTGEIFYKVSDQKMIDDTVVNGSGRFIRWFAQTARLLQTGYLYHYALAMILGILIFLIWYIAG